jgi:hypothetical protein
MTGPTRRWFGIGSAALAVLSCGPRADGEPMPATIVVDQLTAAIDSTVAIELRGFPPRRPVSLTATETFLGGSRWQGQATFISDDNGRIDVAHQAPVSGSYDGVSPMGLFWSMVLRCHSGARALAREPGIHSHKPNPRSPRRDRPIPHNTTVCGYGFRAPTIQVG